LKDIPYFTLNSKGENFIHYLFMNPNLNISESHEILKEIFAKIGENDRISKNFKKFKD